MLYFRYYDNVDGCEINQFLLFFNSTKEKQAGILITA
jgi:hypothetical protein